MSGKIYSNQVPGVELTYELEEGNTFPENISDVFIDYEKPDGTTGRYTGCVHDANAKTVTYNGNSGTSYSSIGRWKFVVVFVDANNDEWPTTAVTEVIYPKFR